MAHLFRHGDTKEIEQDFGIFGAPPQEFLDALEGDDFELWPENAEPLAVFLRLQTQWRVGPAGYTGLDYAGVKAALEFMGKQQTAELFDQIQNMEGAALKALREAKDGG